MNHIFRCIWSKAARTFIAVSEVVSSQGKGASGVTGVAGSSAQHSASSNTSGFALKTLAVAMLSIFSGVALAGPAGGVVTAGQASIATTGANSSTPTTTITQTTQNAALNWSSFNTRAGEAVVFVQPNSNAVALNRVVGADPTSYLGSLSANGKVFLINPNGILFGKGASINVAGLVASTLDINNTDFMAGRYKFAGSSTASVVNQGSITAAEGGYVALLGANISNQGVIAAKLGSVVLAGGQAMTLDVAGDGLLNVSINQGAVDALVHNGGLIQADGGQVLLTTQAAGQLLKTVVNNTGVIQAHTLQNKNGVIKLLGDMQSGTVNVGGTLDASAPANNNATGNPTGGNGGFIETSAAHVHIANDARVTTLAANGLNGSWLIDPVDYTIAATGGDQTGAQLAAALAGGNVTIQSSSGSTGTAGNINVNDNVSWSANQLTLNAYNDININSPMNGGAAGSLVLLYGQGTANGTIGTTPATYNVKAPITLAAGPNFSTQLGSTGPLVNYTVITALGAQGSTTATDLQGINGNLAGNYVLGANIDASPTGAGAWYTAGGFTPIGDNTTNFSGTFDGLGHTITGLTINQPATDYVGLFGKNSTASVISNVGLVGAGVTGRNYTGGLEGWNSGAINNSYATGSVAGAVGTGGLVGVSYGTNSNSYATGSVTGTGNFTGGLAGYSKGAISNCYATGSVSGTGYYTGGLAGYDGGTISNSYATGAVTENGSGGGLVGYNSGTIINSYATGSVTLTGSNNVIGGLVGYNTGTINNSYATGTVTGRAYNGGLVGYNTGTINNNYATGPVTGEYATGGLVGTNNSTISNSYATGAVTGDQQTGGMVGYNGGAISNSYWNTSTNGGLAGVGNGTSTGATGLTTAQMQMQSSFAGFDFTNIWTIYEGYTAPLLRSFMTPLTVTAGATTTYNGTAVSGLSGLTYSIASPDTSHLLGTAVYSNPNMVNAGSYANAAPTGLYSDQQGYLISTASGTVTINPAPLTVSASAASKTYGQTATPSAFTSTGLLNSETIGGVSQTSPGSVATANVGSYALTPSGATGGSFNAANYSISYVDGTLTVTPAPVIVSQPPAAQPPVIQPPVIPRIDGRHAFIEGARNVLATLNVAPNAELPAEGHNAGDNIPPNLWPVSDYLLTISRELTVRR
jgi:filamentous hemagglutinin family protein